MINITFPDGAVRQYENGVTALDIAKSISEGLARKVLAAKVNGEVRDSMRPIYEDAEVKLLTWNDAEGKSTFWHSSAHLMAEAVESLFPGVKFWVGPPVENGFYYDVDLGDRKMSEEDLRDVTVCVRLKKRFFGADEVTTTIDAPAEVLRKIAAGGELFP